MVCIRYTEREFIHITSEMEACGYLSMSRYLRDRTMGRHISPMKTVYLHDNELRTQINALSAGISRIGVNYNQATKRFQSLCEMKRPDGSPVINARAADVYLRDLRQLTLSLTDQMKRIIETVDRMEFSAIDNK